MNGSDRERLSHRRSRTPRTRMTLSASAALAVAFSMLALTPAASAAPAPQSSTRAAAATTAASTRVEYSQSCDILQGPPDPCIEWHNGKVRGGPNSTLWYSQVLQICTKTNLRHCGWQNKGSVVYHKAYTAWYQISRQPAWYRGCWQNVSGGRWNCMGNAYVVQLEYGS